MTDKQVARITVYGKHDDGQLIVNVLHYMSDPTHPIGGAGLPLITILSLFRTMWRTGILPVLTSTYRVLDYKGEVWRNLTAVAPGDPPAQPILVEANSIPGDATLDKGGVLTPPNTLFEAVGVKKQTGVPGKRWRGAIRLGPVADADVLNSKIVAGSLAAWNAAISFLDDSLVDAPTNTGVVPCVYSLAAHRAAGGASDAVDMAKVVILTTLRPYLSSQVSRKMGRGAQ